MYFNRQTGAVLLCMAFAIPMMLVLIALVIDINHRQTVKLEMTNAADAGALAGALLLGSNVVDARSASESLIQEHTIMNRDILIGEITVDTGMWEPTTRSYTENSSLASPNAIRVQITHQRDYFFSGIGGLFDYIQNVLVIAYQPNLTGSEKPRLVY